MLCPIGTDARYRAPFRQTEGVAPAAGLEWILLEWKLLEWKLLEWKLLERDVS
jgi:hypothetical protein